MYVPPSVEDSYYQHLSELLSSLPLDKDVLILGDFNSPDIDWDLLHGGTSLSSSFCDLTVNLNLRQFSTHIAGNTLDLILTNSDNLIDDVIILEPLPSGLSSDHFIVMFSVLIPHPTMRAPHDVSLRLTWM